jgi:hypothetical protein
VRCPRCGNENSETNRFCGMCGSPLRQAPPPKPAEEPASKVSQASSGGSAAPSGMRTAPAAAAQPPRPRAEEGTVISGPSFLGLNQPPPTAKRSSLSIDPHSSSRNLDYLLEDDEPSRGGGWKLAVMFVALILAVGFGYLRWKNGGLAWLNTIGNKPSAQVAQTPAPNTASSPTEAPSSPGAITPAPAASSSPAASTPVPQSSTPPASASTNPPAVSPTAGNPNGAATAPAASSPPVASPPASSPDSATPAAPKNTTPANAGTADDSDSKASKDTSSASDDDDTSAASETAKPAPARKPSPSVTRAASDPVAEAQKYLYGKGVSQDCDHGLRLLKPAANAANTKAMIEMGALYSAGLCTPRDLPTAYRWFALALRKEPDNLSVQTDLQKLWGEMTQPERQLAIRLTQ